jgi:lipopolysaccharide/colanic/teichoic acid biosynthesis glycosyltransferase
MYNFLKRFLDIVLVIIGLVLISPAIVIIAILIKLDSKGPVFYRQLRIGKDGKTFYLYTFRTMAVDAPKFIKIGKVLRQTGLTHLPNLINVLSGEMSFVGPSPVLPFEYEKYKDWEKERQRSKPGMTGYWQVYRKENTFEEMIRMDSEYVKKQSILLDLKIFLKTPFVVFDIVRPKETETDNSGDK